MSGHCTLNGTGDLGIYGEIRPCIGSCVDIVKVCKSGLIQIRTWNGKLFSVPKRNLSANQGAPQ